MAFKKTRIKYYDTLRFLAILSIIILHTFQLVHDEKIIADFLFSFNEFVRFGVPVFLMITGALLLNREMEIGEFFKKRLNRIVYPFIFFFIIHRISLYYLGTHYAPNLLWRVFSSPLGYNWYFWLIIGVYLAIPIINKFIQNADMKELEYFIWVILFASLFYQIIILFKAKTAMDMSFFMGPIAYVVFGYYLSIKEFDIDTNKLITIALAVFVIVTLIKMGSNLDWPFNLGHNFHATRTDIVKSSLDLGILQFIQAGAVFIIFKNLYQSSSGIYSKIRNFLEANIVNRFILSISRASYGMYLVNNTLKIAFMVLITGLTFTKPEKVLLIISISLAITFISWLIVLVVNRIPHFDKLSGYY